MKKKHRFEKFFHSVFSNHSDSDNSEALPDREEIDKNAERILKMLRTEEGGAITSENPFDKAELASLIDDFHKGYQAVHGRYDHLMTKLKKRIYSKSSDNGSFSIDFNSSDSEDTDLGSEELSDNKGKLDKLQEGKAEYVSFQDYKNLQEQLQNMKIRSSEFEAVIIQLNEKLNEERNLSAELEESAKLLQTEMEAINLHMRIIQEENESLKSENAEALRRIHEADKSIEEFQIELYQIKGEIEKVRSENSILKEELEKTSNEVTTLNQRLISVTEEKDTLRSGNLAFLKRIQETEKALAAATDQADQELKLVTGESETQNANLSSENECLKLRLAAAAQKEADLSLRLSAAEEEISSLKLQILRSSSLIQEAEKTIGDLRSEAELLREENLKLQDINNDLEISINSLGLESVVMEKEKNALFLEVSEVMMKLKQSENKEKELENELKHFREDIFMLQQLQIKVQEGEKIIDDLKANTKQLRADNSELNGSVINLGLQLETSNLQLNDLNATLVNAEAEKVSLTSEIETMKSELRQAELNEQKLEADLGRLQEENVILEAKSGQKVKERDNLEESCQELLEKLQLIEVGKQDEDRENVMLNKQVQNLEVKLRLSNQKLKITETESRDREEGYLRFIEAMKEERRIVEEQMLRLSREVSLFKNEVGQLKEVAEAGISGVAKGCGHLESLVEENSADILQQLATCNKELIELKKWITKLTDEKQELSVRLKYKEGIMSMMKDESKNIADKVTKKEIELAILRTNAFEFEERMRQLEDMLKEKQEELSEKDEAKKEVIRQLCLLAEYYREKCDHLCKYLSLVLRKGRQSA